MGGSILTPTDIPMGMPYVFRARALEAWGFNCTCSMCTAPEAEREKSDTRRKRLVEITYTLSGQAGVQLEYEDIVALSGELLQIAETERMERNMADYYANLMKLFYGYGDVEASIRFGKAALERLEGFGGNWEDPFSRTLKEKLKVLES